MHDAIDAVLDEAWNEIVDTAIPLTDALLRDYETRRRRVPKMDEDPPTTHVALPAPSTLPVFGDEVSSGSLDPASYAGFWVEAGILSGGSRNQLELPRHANEFFGFREAIYADDQHTIGMPTLSARGRIWGDRKLTWHGHNRMERLNLPTAFQGGFSDYGGPLFSFVAGGTGSRSRLLIQTVR